MNHVPNHPSRPAAVDWALILFAAVTVWALVIGAAVKAVAAPVAYVVDGDTLRLDSGAYVRIIGIDTPEVGECGYEAAKRALDRMLDDDVKLRRPAGYSNTDRYGRLLRYVQNDRGRDAGLALIRRGLASARYDAQDGYPRHPRQEFYRLADAVNPDVCGSPREPVARKARKARKAWGTDVTHSRHDTGYGYSTPIHVVCTNGNHRWLYRGQSTALGSDSSSCGWGGVQWIVTGAGQAVRCFNQLPPYGSHYFIGGYREVPSWASLDCYLQRRI